MRSSQPSRASRSSSTQTTHTTRMTAFAAASVSLALLGACAHRTSDAGRASLTSADVQADASALSALGHGADPRPIPDGVITPASGPVDGEAEAIAQALCERKLACDELGPNRPYSSAESCLGPARRAGQTHLGQVSSCTRGIRQGALDGCVQAIRAEACSSVLDVTSRVSACRSESLCQ